MLLIIVLWVIILSNKIINTLGVSALNNFDNMVVMKIILNRGTIIIILKAPLLFLCA